MQRVAVMMLTLGLLVEASWGQINDDARRCLEEAGKNPDLAISHCTRAIQSGQLSNDNLAATYNNRGVAFNDKGNYDRAIQDFDQAIRLDPNGASSAYDNRGNAYNRKGNYDRAISDYDQSIGRDGNNAGTYSNRGNAYIAKGDYDRGIRDFNEAIRLDRNNVGAYSNRGNAYVAKGDYDRGIQDLNEAIRLSPKNDSAYFDLGHLFFIQGRFRQSAEALTKAAFIDPQNQYYLLYLYLAQTRSSDGPTAQRELGERSVKLTKREWPVAVIEFYLGKIDEKIMFAAANDTDPQKKLEQRCEANFYAGQARLIKGGTVKDAIELLLRTVERDCPRTLTERQTAAAELKRLGQK